MRRVQRIGQTGSYSQSRTTRRLASLAVRALIEEAELTPKPALVDGREGGAQEDLSVFLMRRSAHCLAPFFELIALTSLEQIPTQTLREEVGTIGRWAEHFMLGSTRTVRKTQGSPISRSSSVPRLGRCKPVATNTTILDAGIPPRIRASMSGRKKSAFGTGRVIPEISIAALRAALASSTSGAVPTGLAKARALGWPVCAAR
jgi:hypothetical protein